MQEAEAEAEAQINPIRLDRCLDALGHCLVVSDDNLVAIRAANEFLTFLFHAHVTKVLDLVIQRFPSQGLCANAFLDKLSNSRALRGNFEMLKTFLASPTILQYSLPSKALARPARQCPFTSSLWSSVLHVATTSSNT